MINLSLTEKNRKMKISLCIAVIFFCSLQIVWAKPAPSVKVELNWVDPPSVNQISKIDIAVFSHISSEQLKLTVTVPKGISIIQGDAKSVISIEKGKVKHIIFNVFIEDNVSGEISAEIHMGSTKSSFFFASDTLSVDFSEAAKSKLRARERIEPEFKRTERQGVGLREYRISN